MTNIHGKPPASRQPLGLLAGHLLHGLANTSLRFCVLRGDENLPEGLEHDLDLAVAPGDFRGFMAAVQRIAHACNGRCVPTRSAPEFESFVIIANDHDSGIIAIKIDVWTAMLWRGRRWLGVDSIVARAHQRRGWPSADNPDRAVVRAVKDLLHHGNLPERARQKISQELRDAPNLERAVSGLNIPRALMPHFTHALQVQSWDEIEAFAAKFKRHLRRASMFKPWIHGRPRLRWALAWARTAFFPPGRFIAFVGPDGSGKTTTVRGLESALVGPWFQSTVYCHGRFGPLPDIRRLIRAQDQSTAPSNPGPAKNRSIPSALLNLAYYSVDGLLARPRLWRWKRQGALILADRYFHDRYYQSGWRTVPPLLVRLFESAIPKPDLIVFLQADPAFIHARKPELDEDEIRIQANRIARHLTPRRRVRTVSTAQPVGETIRDVARLIPGTECPEARHE